MKHFLKVRNEAILAGGLWIVFAAWTIGACWLLGYLPETTTTVFGVPSWVVWGVMVPWVVATIANSIFALVILADDE